MMSEVKKFCKICNCYYHGQTCNKHESEDEEAYNKEHCEKPIFEIVRQHTELDKQIQEFVDSELEHIEGDCTCESESDLVWDVYPEGATDYTICLRCGGVVTPTGYYS